MISIKNTTIKNWYYGFGVDFSSATHITGNYECEIFKASDGNFYLKYFNGSFEQYVDPNS